MIKIANSIYPDLTTNFPMEIDPNRNFKDVDISSKALMDTYYNLLNSNNFEGIKTLLENNPQLKDMIVNAELIQLIYDQSIASQRFYLSDFREYIENVIQYKGDWVSTTQYKKFDVVKYNQFTYFAIQLVIPIGTLPTDTNYWVQWSIKGDQGVSGTGLSPRGNWNSTTQYYMYDLVSYNNTLWYALRNNIDQNPLVSNLDWTKSLEIVPVTGGDSDTATVSVDGNNKIIVNVKPRYLTVSGSNSYIGSITGLSGYVEGLLIYVKFTNANTQTAVTININSFGAKDIVKSNNQSIKIGDIASGSTYLLIYNGTSFEILSVTNKFGDNQLASPEFTGAPTAPTAEVSTNNTQIATTAFVKNQGYATINSPSFSGVPTAPTAATSTSTTQIATTAYVKNQSYATLNSPALTGVPTAPTAATTVNNTQIATTAFVKSLLSGVGGIIVQSTSPTGSASQMWVNSTNGLAHYWNGAAWTPIKASYA